MSRWTNDSADPSGGLPSGPNGRTSVLLLASLLVSSFVPELAEASAFGARGPAAQAPTLADSREVMIFSEQVPNNVNDYWGIELWDCNDGAGGQGNISSNCTLGADLVELAGDAIATSTLSSLGNGVQVASTAGNFTDGTTEHAFLGYGVDGATRLLWCLFPYNSTGTCTGAGALGPEPFAADVDVDVFGVDGALHHRLVQMTTAQLDEDPYDEVVIAYWNDQQKISMTVLDWDNAGPGLQFYTRYELAPASQPDLPASLYRSAVFGLGAVDFDGDLIDTIAIVAPSGPGDPGKANDFDHYEVSFFEFVTNETACGGPGTAPCLLARGQDTFEEHKMAYNNVGSPDGDHMDFYYPYGQGRTAGCGGPTPDSCYLGAVKVEGARLTPDASAASTLDSGVSESLVVALRYTFENGDGGSFREKTTDLVMMHPERASNGVDAQLARINGCTPNGGGTAFAEEILCLAADPNDPAQGINAVLHHRELFYFTSQPFNVFPQTDGMCLAVGDLGGSALDEVALVEFRKVTVLDSLVGGGEAVELQQLAQANLVAAAGNGSGLHQNECEIGIADLDAYLLDQTNDLESWRPEIVVSRTSAEFELIFDGLAFDSRVLHRRILDVLEVSWDTSSTITGLLQTAASLNPVTEIKEVSDVDFSVYEPTKAFATSVFDTDNDRILLGEPEVILSDLVSQPILTLSAPPRHLDFIDEFDANDCVEPGKAPDLLDFLWTDCDNNAPIPDCHGFETFYTSVANAELSSSITNSVTRSVGGGFSFGGFGASVERKFTDTATSTGIDTVTVSQGTSTFFKDIAVVRDTEYRIYEYPVLQGGAPLVSGGGDPVSVLITRNLPSVSRGEDIMNVDLLVPTHVPGNLLSYKPLSWFQDPSRCGGGMTCQIGNTGGGTLDVPLREVGVNIEPFGFFQIDDSNTMGTEATSEGNLAVSVGASGTYKGLTVSVSGDYSQSTLRAHSTVVKRATGLGWNFMDSSSADPDLAYGATAIILVDENGALTLDYAVDIRPNTCLQDVYSARSDPALALPLRRTEGSQALSSTEEDLETKEIACRFDPIAGEYELAARIHNYSLADTSVTVAVDFHLGNPQQGAPQIGNRVLTQASILGQATGNNEEDVFLSIPAVCDGAGSVVQGTACIEDDDCRLAGENVGACVADLVPPYSVCDRDADTLEGAICTTNDDCRTGPADEIGTCVPEHRLFVRLDEGNAIPEISEDNNLGWARLEGACLPKLPVPEPGFVTGLLAGVAGLGRLSRRGSKPGA